MFLQIPEKHCVFGQLGLIFIWSCFVFCLLFLLNYVICRKNQELEEWLEVEPESDEILTALHMVEDFASKADEILAKLSKLDAITTVSYCNRL